MTRYDLPDTALDQLEPDQREQVHCLNLTGKSARIAGLEDYTRALIFYAEDTSTGAIPSRLWQLNNLGHLIARRPETRPARTTSTGHPVRAARLRQRFRPWPY